MSGEICYAGYPFAVVREEPRRGSKALKQIIWGDWAKITKPDAGNGFREVRVRNADGFVEAGSLQSSRLLELVFVDIGQGDGCLLITPDDRIVVIDAGEGDNMVRFLNWRFGKFRKEIQFEAAILSHSDQDHYGGFKALFEAKNLTFRNVYTNGFMERDAAKAEILGPRMEHDGESYITDLVCDMMALREFVQDSAKVGAKKYPTMLRKALEEGKFEKFLALSVADEFVPGFDPQHSDVVMELLGPVRENVNGTEGLRWFGDPGKTKNGHSVVVRIRYGQVTIFAGGDLNTESESLLLSHHTGAGRVPRDEEERLALAEKAREKLSADFAKACHHGSSDVSAAFLHALHPLATVISSGDAESFSHPRADTLGLIGKHSRGVRPCIFSTELARSAPERIKNSRDLRSQLDECIAALQTGLSEAERKQVTEKIAEISKALERSVATYGAINLRTDGNRAIVAQRLEAPREKDKQWDIYRFERDGDGKPLQLVSKTLGKKLRRARDED